MIATHLQLQALGQVHSAQLEGWLPDVAVKVQYPGISVSIESDMTLIRGVAHGLIKHKINTAIFR